MATQLLELFQSIDRKQTFPKGTLIIRQGDRLDNIYFIQKGLVSVSDVDKFGDKRTVAFFSKNHMMPVTWLLSEISPTGARYDYEAASEVECFVAPHKIVREAVEKDPQLICQLLDMITKSYINATVRIHNLQKTNVAERMDFILYYIAKTLGTQLDNGLIQIDAALTHQIIADFTGLSRETVSHQLAKDRYKAIIIKNSRVTYIDTQHLRLESMPEIYGIDFS